MLTANEGLSYVNGYDDPAILAGAGTIGMEMIDDVPQVDVVVVPIGGAGLIAGISCAIKTLKPDTKVIGVEPIFCASYTAALKAGKPVPAQFTPTLADGLAVPVVGSHAFEVARHYVDECVLTSEKEISLAVLRLLENEKIVVEGGGAAGLAALLPGGALDRADMKGKTIIVPLCGGNIDTTVLGRVLDRGLAADQRLVNLSPLCRTDPEVFPSSLLFLVKRGPVSRISTTSALGSTPQWTKSRSRSLSNSRELITASDYNRL
jgi:threonine dehydratase